MPTYINGRLVANGALVVQATNVGILKIGSPAWTNVQDAINQSLSAGTSENQAYITDAGSGNFDVAAGLGFIRNSDDNNAPLYAFEWSSAPGQASILDDVVYVGIEFNAGSPQVAVRSDENWNEHDEFPLGTVVNESGTLHILNNPLVASDVNREVQHRFYETLPLQRANRIGGIILGENATRLPTVTPGELYDRLNEFSVGQAGPYTFDSYYRDGVGGFTRVAAQTQWPNTQYDDNSGVLQTMTNNWYACCWFYIEADNALVMLYPQEESSSLAAAENHAPPSSVPLRVQKHGVLIGRIIYQKSAASATRIESVYSTDFSTQGVTSHLNLTDIGTNTHTQIDSFLTTHKTRHESGGVDSIKLDDLASPDDNTDLNASTAAHGLLRKLDNIATNYLDGQGNWTVPIGCICANLNTSATLRSTSSTTWQTGLTQALPADSNEYLVLFFGVVDADFATQAQPEIRCVNTATSFVFAQGTPNIYWFSSGSPTSDFKPFAFCSSYITGNKTVGIQYRRNPNGPAGTIYLNDQRIFYLRI